MRIWYITAAALVLKSFANARALPLGYEPGGLLTARVDLPVSGSARRGRVIKAAAYLAGTRKLTCSANTALATLTPAMRDEAANVGPPLIPGFIGPER